MERSCVRGWKLIWLVSRSSQQFQLNTLQSNCIALLSSFGCSLYFDPCRRIGKMFVSWSDNRTPVLSSFIPATCPVVTLKRDSVLWHTAGKSHFLPVSRLFPPSLLLLSHDGSDWRTETEAKTSGALMGAEGWRAEACGERVMRFWTVLDKRRQQCRRRLLKVCKTCSQYPHRKQSYGTKQLLIQV